MLYTGRHIRYRSIIGLYINQGRSQPKCDGGASQLSSTVANLHVRHPSVWSNKIIHIIYFLKKVHCNLLIHEALATVSAAW